MECDVKPDIKNIDARQLDNNIEHITNKTIKYLTTNIRQNDNTKLDNKVESDYATSISNLSSPLPPIDVRDGCTTIINTPSTHLTANDSIKNKNNNNIDLSKVSENVIAKPITQTSITPVEKVVKHSHHLRKPVPRVLDKSLSYKNSNEHSPVKQKQASTMKDVLASIPSFSVKPRRRNNKKMSTAAQIEQTREGCIDLETPDSILVGSNLRALLNKHTFSILPHLYQLKLIQLLPSVDRPPHIENDERSPACRLSSSSLNNEFFARACLEWRERLSEGEFTPENQLKLKSEAEKEKTKLDPWKLKHFEPIWGSGNGNSSSTSTNKCNKNNLITNSSRPSLKTTIKLRPTTSIAASTTIQSTSPTNKTLYIDSNCNNMSSSAISPKRVRTVGAVTRASGVNIQSPNTNSKVPASLPELLPIQPKTSRTNYMNLKDSQCETENSFEAVREPVFTNDELDSGSMVIESRTDTHTLKRNYIEDDDINLLNCKLFKKDTIDPVLESHEDTEDANETDGVIMYTIEEEDHIINSNTCSELSTINSCDNMLTITNYSSELSNSNDNNNKLDNYNNESIEKSPSEVNLNSVLQSDPEEFSNKSSEEKRTDDFEGTEIDDNVMFEENDNNSSSDNNLYNNVINLQNSNSNLILNNDEISTHLELSSTSLKSETSNMQHFQTFHNILEVNKNQQQNLLNLQQQESKCNLNNMAVTSDLMEPLKDHHLDHLEEKFIDAETYILESGEISGDIIVETSDNSRSNDKNHDELFTPEEVYETVASNEMSSEISKLDNNNESNDIKEEVKEEIIVEENSFIVPPEWPFSNMKMDSKLVVESFQMEDGNIILSHNPQQLLQHQQLQQQRQQTVYKTGPPEVKGRDSNDKNNLETEVTSTVINNNNSNNNINNNNSSSSISNNMHIKNCNTFINNIIMENDKNFKVKRISNAILSTAPTAIYTAKPTTSKPQTHYIVSKTVPTPTCNAPQSPSITMKNISLPMKIGDKSYVKLNQQQQAAPHIIEIPSPAKIISAPSSTTNFITINNKNFVSQQLQQQTTGVPTTTIRLNKNSSKQVVMPRQIIQIQQQQQLPQHQQIQIIQKPIQQQKIIMSTSTLQQSRNIVVNQQQRLPLQQQQQQPQAQQQLQQQLPSQVMVNTVNIQNKKKTESVQNIVKNSGIVSVSGNSASSSGSGRGNRSNSNNRPPPGAVNLERSYQICQAVIQNSPNRHQLKCQLKPPPPFLNATANTGSTTTTTATISNNNSNCGNSPITIKKEDQTQYGIVTSSNKLGPRMVFSNKKNNFVPQRKASPILVRQVLQPNHVVTVMTTSASAGGLTQTQPQTQRIISNDPFEQNLGQYVLVQRATIAANAAGISTSDNLTPRSSSAPPAQNLQIHGLSGMPLTIGGRGRPASVDVEPPISLPESQHNLGPNPGTQAVSKRIVNHGIVYGDVSIDTNIQNYAAAASGENSSSNCACSLNAMVICQQCGAFCHDDCISASKLCISCIR